MERKSIVCLLLAGTFTLVPLGVPSHAMDMDDGASTKNFFQERGGPHWMVTPALNGGYNDMGRGYNDYEDIGNIGFDLYFRPPRPIAGDPTWRDRMMFRLSADYFPLQVPPYARGLTEDIYSLNCAVLYQLVSFSKPEANQWTPFFGGGFGMYWDRTTLEIPAVGSVSGTASYWGANACAGVFLPSFFGRARLAPEVRYHTQRTVKNYWTSNTTYQMGLLIWFDPVSYD